MLNTYKNRDLALLLVRVALGAAYINHGLMKVYAMPMIVHFFGTLGLPPFMAYFVTTVELVSAVLMICGVFVEIAGVALAIDMTSAILLTGIGRGFAAHELEILLGLMALAVALSGAGRYSLAALWKKSSSNTTPATQVA